MNDAPSLVSCPACAITMDVSGCSPFSCIACPTCGETTRVRRTIQHFEIQREIGRGGMSQVFLAKDSSLDRLVAIKILLDRFSHDDERLKQFEKEAQITASFVHPHVVKVYAVGRDQGDLFIVMELVEKGSLDELLAQDGKVPERQALQWTLQTAQGLQAAYQNGLIHRDVKPGNILLGKDRSAKLVDFGLALMFHREEDSSSDVWATPYYVSPEKLLGNEEDHRSDIYSLGATLFHLLVGTPSFTVTTGSYEELHAAKTTAVPMKPLLAVASPTTCAIIDRMMAVDPNERPATYEFLLSEIEHALSLCGTAQHKPNLTHSPTKRVFALAAGLLFLSTLAWLATSRPTQPVAPVPLITREEQSPLGKASADSFAHAREQFLSGALTEAIAGFHSVCQDPETPNGVRQWARFHQGIALLLQGNLEDARPVFAQLKDQPATNDALNGFFQDLSALIADTSPIPSELAKDIPPGSYHPLALLSYGLKNFELGAFPEASAHLERFVIMQPGTDYQWIASYPPLIRDHLADLALLQPLESVSTLTDQDKLTQSLTSLPKLHQTCKTPRAQRFLAEREHQLRTQLKAVKISAETTQATQESNEAQALKELRSKLAPLQERLQFDQGLAILRDETPTFTTPEGSLALEDHLHFWTQAASFLHHLLSGMPGNEVLISQRHGQQILADVKEASHSAITLQRRSGEITLPLESVAPSTFVQLAKANLKEIRDANAYYEQLEGLICFAHLSGLDKVANKQARTLARENRPFRLRWQRWQTFLNETSHEE